jgi:HEAT repeat protein
LALLESPHENVVEAARIALGEFNVDRYRATFDYLTQEARTVTGDLVKRVDPTFVAGVRDDLLSPARSRRLRAIEMATVADVVDKVEQELIGCLEDEDYFIRAATAWALGRSDSPSARRALTEALDDRSLAVQQAARGSLSDLLSADAKVSGPAKQRW